MKKDEEEKVKKQEKQEKEEEEEQKKEEEENQKNPWVLRVTRGFCKSFITTTVKIVSINFGSIFIFLSTFLHIRRSVHWHCKSTKITFSVSHNYA
jgi:hypothetical protein